MKDRKFGVAVIGCGLIGQKRVKSLPDRCHLVTVFDSNREAAVKAVGTNSDAIIASSLNEAIGHSDVDIVVVATAHAGLSTSALAAVREGKHVLMEKPGARTAQELAEVALLADENDLVVHVGYNHRFHPSMLMARDLIRSGKYGELLWVRGRYGHGGRVGYDKEWRANREISGGGELLDQGSHLIDLTRFFFGDVLLTHSRLTTAFWDMEVEDNAFLELQPTTGGTAWMHATWTEWKNTFSLEITLRTAKIDINGLGGSYGPETLTLYEMQPEMGPPPSQTWTWTEADHSWDAELADLLQAIDGGPSLGATIDDAVATLTIIEEAYSK